MIASVLPLALPLFYVRHVDQSSPACRSSQTRRPAYRKNVGKTSVATFGLPHTSTPDGKAHTQISRNHLFTATKLCKITSRTLLHDLFDPLPRSKPPQPHSKTPTLLPLPLTLGPNLQTIPTKSRNQLPYRAATPLDLPRFEFIRTCAPRNTQALECRGAGAGNLGEGLICACPALGCDRLWRR